MPGRFTFVMEQTLGHVPFSQNLQRSISNFNDADTTVNWLPVRFDVQTKLEKLPVISNWSFRGSMQARRLIAAEQKTNGWSDLYLFHTQVISLLAPGWIPANVPLVISLDATPLNYDSIGVAYGHHPGNPVLEKLKYRLNRRAFHRANYLITWSEWARQSLIKDYGVPGDKVEVVYPGVNLDFWAEGLKRPKEKPGKKLRLLFVGGDFERKGGKLLYEAFRRHLSDRYELCLITRAEVEPAEGVIVRNGIQPNSPTIQELVREADVFVLPTEGDCLSVAITEAMAAGLPVLTTNVGAQEEPVVNGLNGFIINPRDDDSLVKNLLRLADEPELRWKMGAASRLRAEQLFDVAKNGPRVLEICKNLTGQPGKFEPVTIKR